MPLLNGISIKMKSNQSTTTVMVAVRDSNAIKLQLNFFFQRNCNGFPLIGRRMETGRQVQPGCDSLGLAETERQATYLKLQLLSSLKEKALHSFIHSFVRVRSFSRCQV